LIEEALEQIDEPDIKDYKIGEKMPRIMNNWDIAIPFSAFFDIHEIKDHNAENRSIKVTLSVTLRMKFTNLKNMP